MYLNSLPLDYHYVNQEIQDVEIDFEIYPAYHNPCHSLPPDFREPVQRIPIRHRRAGNRGCLERMVPAEFSTGAV